MPELAFFIGKGGVGKTTVSAAYAVRAALNRHSHVLLVSTDPAHSLGDVLQTNLGPSKKPKLLEGSRVSAWEIDSQKLFCSFLDQHKTGLIEAIERGSLFTADEIASLLETTLPGMSEIAALLAIQDAIESQKYTHIVVDTAPFGHTLRLFGLPQQFECLLNFLELSADRDRVLAQHFGGRVAGQKHDFVPEWRARLADMRSAFSRAKLFLVTTAESFAVNESVRCLRELRESGPELTLSGIVLNRAVLNPGRCPRCRKRKQGVTVSRTRLKKEFSSIALYFGEDPGPPILGTDALRGFGDHVFDRKRLRRNAASPQKNAIKSFRLTKTEWPRLAAPLSFVLGKGGVGKTTVSAGLALFARAQSTDAMELCSVDPAPSLDDVFESPVSDKSLGVLGDTKLRASEIDSVALFKSWVREIRSEVESATTAQYSGVHVDLSYERRLFSELLEIVPPGIDEVLAIFRIVELLGPSRKVIIDMAPTGHALELLHMPERILVWSRLLLKSLTAHRKLALAREAAVKIAELEVRARELSSLLKSSRQVQIFAAMLPEPLPDRETERLLGDLGDLGLSATAVFVNRVLVPGETKGCAKCALTAEWQASVLSRLKRRLRGKEIYVIRDFGHELAGKRGLTELTSELWRLN